MNTEENTALKRTIETRLAELEKLLETSDEDTKPVAPDVSIGRLSRLDSMQMQQMALEQKRRQQAEVQKLHAALKRMEDGSYGTCMLCRQPIATARLMAQPDTIFCIHCAPG